ncbi:hypothetical protein SHKM778_18310 [Streptomyces sp. KM77-8]|uniref:Uncharacterized protein n=1 Tax=Streptomyces haneummycinicus TaxID=3074435 RepID=A0AAT9HDM0_9ACTN
MADHGPLTGPPLHLTDGEETLAIGAAPTAVAALLASLAAWTLLAVLERSGIRRARTIWTVTACTVLLLSFLPLTANDMDAATRTSLALMHLAVAAVLIPGLAGGVPRAGSSGAKAAVRWRVGIIPPRVRGAVGPQVRLLIEAGAIPAPAGMAPALGPRSMPPSTVPSLGVPVVPRM